MTTATTESTPPTTGCRAYDTLIIKLREAAVLGSVQANVSWDQETMMPPSGAGLRADQLSALSGMIHEMVTSEEVGELLGEAEGDAMLRDDELAQANLREIRRDYDQRTKLPLELVREIARTSSLGMDAWKEARKARDFSKFEPWLQKTVDLSRRKAECLGVPADGEMYDALLDQFEPGVTTAMTHELFKPLRDFTVDLLAKLRETTNEFKELPNADVPGIETDPVAQKEWCRYVLAAMGFDFAAGRLDEAAHPFCSGFGPGDTRLTNRYRADGWLDALSGGMHEGGHGLYEQGLRKSEFFGSPLGESVSLGVHESQSRMWENQIGRSRPFWTWCLPIAKKYLGSALDGLEPEMVFRATNLMMPSFIRVESDELTYNLHIMMRFDFERAMLNGDLAVKDLPSEWNKRVKADWRLDVPDDARGCLQDVHWSMGALGYFPTYTFGNIYAAQLWNTMGEKLPDREAMIERGEFKPILDWLRTNVHEPGRRYPARELIERLTGEPVTTEHLRRHLAAKANDVFGA